MSLMHARKTKITWNPVRGHRLYLMFPDSGFHKARMLTNRMLIFHHPTDMEITKPIYLLRVAEKVFPGEKGDLKVGDHIAREDRSGSH